MCIILHQSFIVDLCSYSLRWNCFLNYYFPLYTASTSCAIFTWHYLPGTDFMIIFKSTFSLRDPKVLPYHPLWIARAIDCSTKYSIGIPPLTAIRKNVIIYKRLTTITTVCSRARCLVATKFNRNPQIETKRIPTQHEVQPTHHFLEIVHR